MYYNDFPRSLEDILIDVFTRRENLRIVITMTLIPSTYRRVPMFKGTLSNTRGFYSCNKFYDSDIIISYRKYGSKSCTISLTDLQ